MWKFGEIHGRAAQVEALFTQMKHPGILTEPSHDLQPCVNVPMDIDMFSGMQTSLRSGDILLRRCGSWEKFMVDQHNSRRFVNQVKHCGVLTEPSHDLHACENVLMHIDMLKHTGVLTEPSHDLHACGNVLMYIDMFSGM